MKVFSFIVRSVCVLHLLLFEFARANRNCEKIYDQHIEENVVKLTYKAAILSSLAYLDYEKNASLPLEVAFRTESSSLQHRISDYLERKRCQLSNVSRSVSSNIKHMLHSVVGKVRKLLWLFVRQLFVLLIPPFLRNNLFIKKYTDFLMKNKPTDTTRKSESSSLPFSSATASAAVNAHHVCPAPEKALEEFRIQWFFTDWHENIWHDTEVMLAESDTTAAIIFRGSDSPSDVFTNSQTLEPATHSHYFGCQEGSIHRGMLNAYARVDAGKITSLGTRDTATTKEAAARALNNNKTNKKENNKSSTSNAAIKRATTDKDVGAFSESIIVSVFDNAQSQRQQNNLKTNTTTILPNTVEVRNVLLSRLLLSAAISALNKGKKLLIAGHSLGGAEASLFALDLVMNHVSSHSECTLLSKWKSQTKSLLERHKERENKKDRNRNKKNTSDHKREETGQKRRGATTEKKEQKYKRRRRKREEKFEGHKYLTEWEIRINALKSLHDDLHAKTNATTTQTKSKNNANTILHGKRHLHRHDCKSQPFYQGKRSNDTFDARLADRIHLITFGQPEFGDAAFYKSIQETSPLAYYMLNYRYTRFVSLSKSPGCQPDIVTEIVDRLGLMLGNRLAGIRKQKIEQLKELLEIQKKSTPEKNNMREKKRAMKHREKERDKHNKHNRRSSSTGTTGEVEGTAATATVSTLDVSTEIRGNNTTTSSTYTSGASTAAPLYETTPNNTATVILNSIDANTNAAADDGDDNGVSVVRGANNESSSSSRSRRRHGGKHGQEHTAIDRDQEVLFQDDDPEPHHSYLEDLSLVDFEAQLGDQIFLCSGSSNDSIDAHSLRHYLIGLHLMAATYSRQSGISDAVYSIPPCGNTQQSWWRWLGNYFQQGLSRSRNSTRGKKKVVADIRGGLSSDRSSHHTDHGNRGDNSSIGSGSGTSSSLTSDKSRTVSGKFPMNADKDAVNKPSNASTITDHLDNNSSSSGNSNNTVTPSTTGNNTTLSSELIQLRLKENGGANKMGISLTTNLRIDTALALGLLPSDHDILVSGVSLEEFKEKHDCVGKQKEQSRRDGFYSILC